MKTKPHRSANAGLRVKSAVRAGADPPNPDFHR
jgi:hypothetical protein